MSSSYTLFDGDITNSSQRTVDRKQESLLKTIKFQLGCIIIGFGLILTLCLLIVLPLELISFLLVKPWTQRKISSILHLIMCSYFIVLTEWWCSTKIRIYVDPQDLLLIKKEHSILLVNHRCSTELLVIASVVNHLGILGNLRSFMKQSLSRLPILGWVWTLQENIFLERNFEKDKAKLGEQLVSLFRHSDPFSFIFFPEGTRFTKEKHERSMKIARQKGLPELKHHLLPRTKGFVTFVQNFVKNFVKNDVDKKQLPVSIIDVIVAIHFEGSESSSWTFADALKGKGANNKVVLRRYPIKDIVLANNDSGECAMWLHKIYQEKDKLMQNYKNSLDCNFFLYGTKLLPSFKLPKSWNMLILVILLDVFLFVPIISKILLILMHGTLFQVNMIFGAVLIISFVYKRLIDGTKN